MAASPRVARRRAARGRRRPRSTSATPAPCCGCCPAGWRGRPAGPGRSTATTRSAAARSTGSSSRCARWAPRSSCREDRLPPLRVEGAPLTGHRLRAAGRQRPGQVVPAVRRPARRGRDPGRRAAADPRPQRAHAGRGRRPRSRGGDGAVTVSPGRAARGRARSSFRRTSPRPPSSSSRRCSCRGSDVSLTGVGLNPTRTGLLGDPRADGGRDRGRAGGRARRRAEPGRSGSAPAQPLQRHRGRRRRGAAGDRRAAAGRAAGLLRRGRRRRSRDAAELRRKESRPDRDRRRRR